MAAEILPHIFERNKDRFMNCTVSTCPLDTSFYYYRVNLGANVAFIVLFGLSAIAYLATLISTRRALAFSVAMLSGVILEVLGYAGRIMSWQDQWMQNGFLMQIVCLTIAPAFMAAGLYLCLRRIVYAFGPDNSRISPEAYTRIFIPCDFLSLLLQAAGGGIASTASHQNKSPDHGDDIMVAGLAFQVFTLLIFMFLCADFALRTRRRYKSMGEAAFDQNPMYVAIRHDWKFKAFLVALTLATICIFWRSVYRVVELGEGWTGALIRRQNLFIAFEGVMVIIAAAALNIFHPAICFREGVSGLGGLGTKRKQQKAEARAEKEGTVGRTEMAATEARSGSGSNSDVELKPETQTAARSAVV